jgi:hypothetical protein
MQMSIDGDMVPNILQLSEMDKILKDPLGIGVITKDEKYPNPNRFFCHWFQVNYFLGIPIYLQHWIEPIDSVYYSIAFLKIIIQLAILFLLAKYISPKTKFWSVKFLLAAVLITPFFQTFGYNQQIGIIDQSVTYDIFYCLPFLFLMLFYYPIYVALRSHTAKDISIPAFISLIPCAVICAFSGPLNLGAAPVIALAIILFIFLDKSKQKEKIQLLNLLPPKIFVVLLFMGLCCGYSLIINSISGTMAEDIPPIGERYYLLLIGIVKFFTGKIALPWLLILLAMNATLLKLSNSENKFNSILQLYKWVLLSGLVYLLLLPLGGYRSYRPYIIRFDTFMPVTIALLWLFGTSTLALVEHIKTNKKYIYYSLIVYTLIWFTQIDKLADKAFDCEKNMLHEIANSKESIVKLSDNCCVVSWQPFYDYRQSENSAELLMKWNIIKEKKLYYFEKK